MTTKIFLTIVIFGFLGCKSVKNSKKNDLSDNKDWKIEALKDYKDSETVSFKIINNTKSNLIIFDPLLKNIEKYNGENWVKVDIPYCPCGDCTNPPETILIASGKEYIFNWDKNLTTCIDEKKSIQKTIPGHYKVVFKYESEVNVRSLKEVIVEFDL